jgi:hypothetical protein
MQQPIELSLNSPNGLIDCRIEREHTDDEQERYSVTILYPNIVSGFSRSEIYCHTMAPDPTTGTYHFLEDDIGIHPKVQALEADIAASIVASNEQYPMLSVCIARAMPLQRSNIGVPAL